MTTQQVSAPRVWWVPDTGDSEQIDSGVYVETALGVAQVDVVYGGTSTHPPGSWPAVPRPTTAVAMVRVDELARLAEMWRSLPSWAAAGGTLAAALADLTGGRS